jgi:hypothetical protein
MSEREMSSGLRQALGIVSEGANQASEDPSGIASIEGQAGEFDEYKETPRDPSENELQVDAIETSVPDLEQSDAKNDYVVTRNHTYALLKATSTAVGRALAVVKETEHPRAFESFNSLVSTARLLTQDLLSLQKSFKEITKDRPEMNQTVNVLVQSGAEGGGVEKPKGTLDIIKELQEAIDSGAIRPIAVNKPKEQPSG